MQFGVVPLNVDNRKIVTQSSSPTTTILIASLKYRVKSWTLINSIGHSYQRSGSGWVAKSFTLEQRLVFVVLEVTVFGKGIETPLMTLSIVRS